MEKLNFGQIIDKFNKYTLTNEEMINVRGGDAEAEPIIKPTVPPVKI
jgi:hypothetical protein